MSWNDPMLIAALLESQRRLRKELTGSPYDITPEEPCSPTHAVRHPSLLAKIRSCLSSGQPPVTCSPQSVPK